MKIKGLLVDNDSYAAGRLKNQLKSFELIEVMGVLSDLEKAFTFVKNINVDVVFIDVNIDVSLSFDWIAQINRSHMVVIYTSQEQYALKSFEFNTLDYLIKPISFDRLLKTMNKVYHLVLAKKSNPNIFTPQAHMFLKVNKKFLKVNLNDVLYIESLKDYIRVFTFEGRHVVHKSLTAIAEELPQSDFIRVHRSYVISIGKITALEGNFIEISKKRIPIGRHYIKEVKKRIFDQSLTFNNK